MKLSAPCRVSQGWHSSAGSGAPQAGYGINPNKSAGNVFMQYGIELAFHPKVDFTRLAYAR